MNRLWIALVLGSLALSVAASGEPVKPAPAGTPATPAEPQYEIRFVDGSVAQIAILDSSLPFTTKFGRLTVPIADIQRLEFGLRYPDGVEAKLQAAVAALGAADFRQREQAQKELLDGAEYSLPLLRAALKNSMQQEQVRRAEEILKKLEDKLPEEKVKLPAYDLLVTSVGTLQGTIDAGSIKARNRYFGDSTLKTSDLRSLRPHRFAGQEQFVLDAAKYGRQQWTDWLDTNLEVSTDSPLELTIEGQIDQWAQEPNRYVCGPNGSGALVPGPGGGPFVPGGFPPAGVTRYVSGAVFGKIGPKGTPFLIGASYKRDKAPASGRLYLIIAPSSWGNETAGEFKVKAKVN